MVLLRELYFSMKRLIFVIMTLCCLSGGAHAFHLDAETPHGPVRITSNYRDILPGEIVKVSLVSHTITSAWARFNNRTYLFVPNSDGASYFSFISIGLDMSPGFHMLHISIRYSDGYEKTVALKLSISDRAFPVKRLTVDEKFIYLSPAVRERVSREKEQVDAVYRIATPAWLGRGRFIVPSPGVMRDNFGEKRIFNGEFTSRHRGVDIRCPHGTDVKASNAGRVVLVGNLYFAGKTVIVDHGAGLFTHYCHLSTILVRNGEMVEKGAIVGKVGSTGRVTGAHLHWGVRLFDHPVNPLSLTYLSFADET